MPGSRGGLLFALAALSLAACTGGAVEPGDATPAPTAAVTTEGPDSAEATPAPTGAPAEGAYPFGPPCDAIDMGAVEQIIGGAPDVALEMEPGEEYPPEADMLPGLTSSGYLCDYRGAGEGEPLRRPQAFVAVEDGGERQYDARVSARLEVQDCRVDLQSPLGPQSSMMRCTFAGEPTLVLVDYLAWDAGVVFQCGAALLADDTDAVEHSAEEFCTDVAGRLADG